MSPGEKTSVITPFANAAVGSFPHKDPQDVCGKILKWLPEIPLWPQLPQLGFRESMYVQSSEGLPCVVLDDERERMFFDTAKDFYGEIERFYEKVVGEDIDAFAITKEVSKGFHALFDAASALNKTNPLKWVKGQVTGPVSFGLTIADQDKRASMYNDELYEAIIKGLAMKSKWEVRELKKLAPNVIIFVDEPYMSSFGSAYISLSREKAIQSLSEIMEAIKSEGGVPGVHCCGNTDWSILMETGVVILNFDAWDNFRGMTLYPQALKAFLESGGILAWGIVPTSQAAEGLDVQRLSKRFDDEVGELVKSGIDRKLISERSIITPSCGTGSLSIGLSESIMNLASGLSMKLKDVSSRW